jgi:AhpD family alkylhydroperoxidase
LSQTTQVTDLGLKTKTPAYMKTRFDIEKVEPNALNALLNLEGYVRSMPLNFTQRELIKIRASQINSCAFCIEMHTADARKHGETEARIYALSAWRESPLFTNEERALLAMTEEVTLIANKGLTDETYAELQKYFDETTIAQLLVQVAMINAWNRLAVSSRAMHAHHLGAAKLNKVGELAH